VSASALLSRRGVARLRNVANPAFDDCRLKPWPCYHRSGSRGRALRREWEDRHGGPWQRRGAGRSPV